MRIEKTNIYKFEELTDESKQHAIDQWYESEDYPFLTDDLTENILCMENNCFSDLESRHSLSWRQGDGFSFSGVLDIGKFLDKIYSEVVFIDLYEELKENFQVVSKYNNGHYAYSSESDIEWNSYSENEDFEQIFEDKILPEIQDYYMNICNESEKYGYAILEYRMDFDEFQHICDSNEYKFYESGKMF